MTRTARYTIVGIALSVAIYCMVTGDRTSALLLCACAILLAFGDRR